MASELFLKTLRKNDKSRQRGGSRLLLFYYFCVKYDILRAIIKELHVKLSIFTPNALISSKKRPILLDENTIFQDFY